MILKRLVIVLSLVLYFGGFGECKKILDDTCLITIDVKHFFDLENVIDEDVAKILVGRAFWCIFHVTSTLYTRIGILPPRYQEALSSIMKILPKFFPCEICRHHMKKLFKSNKPTLNSAKEYAKWLGAAHDSVNSRLGKKKRGICYWDVNFIEIRSLIIRAHIVILTVIAFNYMPDDKQAVDATKKYIGLVPSLFPFDKDFRIVSDIFNKNPPQFESQESLKQWTYEVTLLLRDELFLNKKHCVYNLEL